MQIKLQFLKSNWLLKKDWKQLVFQKRSVEFLIAFFFRFLKYCAFYNLELNSNMRDNILAGKKKWWILNIHLFCLYHFFILVIIQINLFVSLWNKLDSVCQLDLSFDYILTAIERILCSTYAKDRFSFYLIFCHILG